MATNEPDGVTVQCVRCKKTRLLSWEEAASMTMPPACEDDYMPMVTIRATAGLGRVKLREVSS